MAVCNAHPIPSVPNVTLPTILISQGCCVTVCLLTIWRQEQPTASSAQSCSHIACSAQVLQHAQSAVMEDTSVGVPVRSVLLAALPVQATQIVQHVIHLSTSS